MLRVLEERALRGYAALMGVDPILFATPGTHIVETNRRNEPEWSNWMVPLWVMRVESTTVCSVSPSYHAIAVKTIELLSNGSLLAPGLGSAVIALSTSGEWLQREILFLPSNFAPDLSHEVDVVQLLAKHGTDAIRLLSIFDGGVFGIVEEGRVVSHAGVKNKGLLQEITVGTLPKWQRRGFAKAVTAAAIRHILMKDKVAVYVPDTLDNTSSYALAHSLGFKKLAESLDLEYELANDQRT
jgi:hypothetical protein